MAVTAAPSLTIRHATRDDIKDVFAFHESRADEYLWPRPYSYIDALVKGFNVFIVKEGNVVVGIGYLDGDGPRLEFGGVFVEDHLRSRGVAAALARVVIATIYLTDPPQELIAHVHEFNDKPRGLLKQLGFEDTGKIDTPDDPPETMRRNDAGEVVGNLFRFRRSALADCADWFDAFDGVLHGRDETETSLTIEAKIWTERATLVPALRELAAVEES